ncbi:hypothetical protein [Mogibacterium diversum]|uniref:hypothetical protein n=1 Tax=Mogibacterium diversum TaxID=114527 RepID=UPI0026EB51FF|nr:hypothetical protein [Mogibacterium diversum]
MFFDKRDLRVFDNADSRAYFEEILQSYYSKNYRASVVLLYSFIIYDLYNKLQTMDSEGDSKATKKLSEINKMIQDDEKYSKVENEIIQFFKDNCALYFERFTEDIDYLKNCRNKCAHLKVNDNSLFTPSDYHARMLICSMYDNILSVKAPFIMDLFSFVENDVEAYSQTISFSPNNSIDESIITNIKNKYLERMTYDSLKTSYKTFIKLLLVSEDEHCEENATGLYMFAYAITEYLIQNGHSNIFNDDGVLNIFSRIQIDKLKASDLKRNALVGLITTFPAVMDRLKDFADLFSYISECVLLKPQSLCYYHAFYPRDKQTIYEFFKEHDELHTPQSIRTLYNSLKEDNSFSLVEFTELMAGSIPSFNGFCDADCFMAFFIENIELFELEQIKNIRNIYQSKPQCTNRGNYSSEDLKVKEYIDKLENPDRVEGAETVPEADLNEDFPF